MPKTPSVILREELAKKGYELLDIYHGREKDTIRIKNLLNGRVYLIESNKHVRDLIGREDVIKFINELLSRIEER